jgi:hypothetical protein
MLLGGMTCKQRGACQQDRFRSTRRVEQQHSEIGNVAYTDHIESRTRGETPLLTAKVPR